MGGAGWSNEPGRLAERFEGMAPAVCGVNLPDLAAGERVPHCASTNVGNALSLGGPGCCPPLVNIARARYVKAQPVGGEWRRARFG